MANQNFGVHFLFAICLFILLKEAKMQTSSASSTSSSSGSSGISYNTDINDGELGIRMEYDSRQQDPKMSVTIYYETETSIATSFFQQQLSVQILQDFTACGVQWDFMPCGKSKLNGNVLTCPQGENQCTFDKIHACVATMSAQDQLKIGQFVICFFNNNKNVDQCLTDIGLNSDDVNTCAGPQGQGTNECSAFNTKIHGPTAATIQIPTGSSSGTSVTEGTTNFTGVLCRQFANISVQCNACPIEAHKSR